MPHGLATAPSVFQNMINDILRDYLYKFVIAFIDNILIYCPDLSSHMKRIKENKKFLGYNIDTKGVSMDNEKVKAVEAHTKYHKGLTKVSGLHQFLKMVH